jgi:hypothetical protein
VFSELASIQPFKDLQVMRHTALAAFIATGALLTGVAPLAAQEVCQGFGPQTPRDISKRQGTNPRVFTLAPPARTLNLCNIHTHTNAEHKGPGFSVSAGDGEHGGWKCNGSDKLSAAELEDPSHGHGAFHGVKPGDTIEVHWVFSSCDVAPGEGLGACSSPACANPQLRVEAQTFLLVNDPKALNFADYAYAGQKTGATYQPKGLPTRTGKPVVFAGSTTGEKYTSAACSPLQVTWSVRPTCAKLDVNSLHKWAEDGNVFKENHSHGVRQIVSNPALLAPIR